MVGVGWIGLWRCRWEWREEFVVVVKGGWLGKRVGVV